MSIQIRLTRDAITPSLIRKITAMENPRRAISAMGLALVSLAKRAFVDSSMRPAPWAPLKKGGEATLRKTGALWHSIRVVSQDEKSVTVGSDRSYAAVHQLGSKKKNIPARPFFPFTESGSPTAAASRNIEAALRAALAEELKK